MKSFSRRALLALLFLFGTSSFVAAGEAPAHLGVFVVSGTIKNCKLTRLGAAKALDEVPAWRDLAKLLETRFAEMKEEYNALIGLDTICVILTDADRPRRQTVYMIHGDPKIVAVYRNCAWNPKTRALKNGFLAGYQTIDGVEDVVVPFVRQYAPEELKGYERIQGFKEATRKREKESAK